MTQHPTVGFIGYGNMAQAMAKGLIGAKVCAPENICACAAHFDRLQQNAALLGVRALPDAAAVVQASDFVVLAVKPYLIESVAAPLANLLTGKIVISVAAGWNFNRYSAIFPENVHHISTMPNTPIAVGEGILVCEQTHSLTDEEYAAFEQLFRSIALIEPIDTAHLAAAGTLSGCSPAFAAMFLEALADAGVKYGITRPAAYRMAAQVLQGTGALQQATGAHPGAMKDAVCSPGGTTIRGVSALEKSGFRGAVIGAIDAIEGA
jgi:pyrroline-5-carboxylate reductase